MREELARSYRNAGLEVRCLRIGNVVGADPLPMAMPDDKTAPIGIEFFEHGCGPV